MKGGQEGHSSDNFCKERAQPFLGHERGWWKFGSSHPIYHSRLRCPRQCTLSSSLRMRMAVSGTHSAIVESPPKSGHAYAYVVCCALHLLGADAVLIDCPKRLLLHL